MTGHSRINIKSSTFPTFDPAFGFIRGRGLWMSRESWRRDPDLTFAAVTREQGHLRLVSLGGRAEDRWLGSGRGGKAVPGRGPGGSAPMIYSFRDNSSEHGRSSSTDREQAPRDQPGKSPFREVCVENCTYPPAFRACACRRPLEVTRPSCPRAFRGPSCRLSLRWCVSHSTLEKLTRHWSPSLGGLGRWGPWPRGHPRGWPVSHGPTTGPPLRGSLSSTV